MMIECMAGKSASMHGLCHDASPFTFSEETPAIDHFGKLLTAGGSPFVLCCTENQINSLFLLCIRLKTPEFRPEKIDRQPLSTNCFFPAGYNYYGTERLYSGVDGREFEADIFMGIVYYQRLRHMVSDKFQVSLSEANIHVCLHD